MTTGNITPAQWRTFFDSLSKAESVTSAAKKSKISLGSAYYWRKQSTVIAEKWRLAEVAALHYLEDAATKRAVDGVKSKFVQYDRNGKIVAETTKTEYSDRLLLALLAKRDPAYRNNSGDQVQRLLTQELTKMLDILQKGLPPEIYERVIDVLANASGTIDADYRISESPAAYLETRGGSDTDISR